jgi:hypothetical protein
LTPPGVTAQARPNRSAERLLAMGPPAGAPLTLCLPLASGAP